MGAGEPGADHHAGGAGGQGERDVARVAHSPVGPHVAAELAGGSRRTPGPRRTAAGRRRSSSGWCTSRPGPRRPSRCRRRPRSGRGCPRRTTTLPATTGTVGSSGADRARAPRASAPGGRARCRPRGSRRRRPAARRPCAATSPLTPTAAAIRSRPAGSTAGVVERGAQGAGAGEHADQRRRRRPRPPRAGACAACERVEGRPAGRMSAEIVTRCRVHHLLDLGEPVDVDAVRLRDDADRAAVLAPRRRPGGSAWGAATRASADGLVRGQRDRGVEDGVPRLHEPHHLGHDRDRDVLRDDGEAAAAGHGLGHPLAGDRGHVGDDERQGRAGAVGGGQVDVVPAGRRRSCRGTMKTSS